MSTWTVTVRDPTNTTTIATVTDGLDTTTGEVVLRGFDPPVVTPPGAGKVLNLFARQDKLQAEPRAIIQFSVDGTPVFWGPAVITPTLDSPGAGPRDEDRDALERITVVGGEQLLKDSIVGPRLFDRESMSDLGSNDVSTVALELCELYAHPALTVDYMNFPATGAVISVWYSPEDTLLNVLTKLAETVPGGASVWVDASGAVHFEAIS